MACGSGADTSLMDFGYIAESTWGTTPSSPAFQLVRITGESLTSEKGTDSPQEIRADRQVPDLVETSRSVSGGFQGVLSYGEYDDFFAGAHGSTWETAANNSGVSATFSNSSSNITGTGIGTNVETGDVVRIVSTINDGYFVVTNAVSANELTLSPAPSDETATAALYSQRLGMGSTCSPFSFIKRFTDIANGTSGKHVLYNGCVIGGYQLSVNAEGFIEVNFDVMGRGTVSSDETSPTSATFTAVGGNEVMSAASGIGTIYDNNSVISSGLTALSVNVNGNLRNKPQIGSLYPYGVGLGTFTVDGGMTAYFTNDTLLTKMLNNTATSLWFVAYDNSSSPTTGNAYAWRVNRMKYASAGPGASGPNQDVLEDINFTGIYDSTVGYAVSMFRFPAA